MSDPQAIAFLQTLFRPGDVIAFRPIETWIERGKKRSRVDHAGIDYHIFGTQSSGGVWSPDLAQTRACVDRQLERSRGQNTNVFFGVCPRFAPKYYDQAWQIRVVYCMWADLDKCKPENSATHCEKAGIAPPSIVVASGNGTHLYWLLDTPYHIDDVGDPPPVCVEAVEDQGKTKRRRYFLDGGEKVYLDIQANVPPLSPRAKLVQDVLAGIAAKLDGDSTIDLSRILRLPGSMNRKDAKNGRAPVPCDLIQCRGDLRYDLQTFLPLAKTSPTHIRREKINQIPLPVAQRISKIQRKSLAEKIAYCAVAEDRSYADFALCCFAVEEGFTRDSVWEQVRSVGKFKDRGESYFRQTWEKAELKTRENLFLKLEAKEKKKELAAHTQALAEDVTGAAEDQPNEDDGDPHRLARLFLRLPSTGPCVLWQGAFYRWRNGRYKDWGDDNLKATLNAAIKAEFDRINVIDRLNWTEQGDTEKRCPTARQVTVNLVTNTLAAIKAQVRIDDAIQTPCWLDGTDRPDCLAMENGILDLNALLAGREDYLLPLSPQWFAMTRLDYPYVPGAECPIWESLLAENMEGDEERIAVLQEWAGYLLTRDTKQQKFLVMEGEGANGKSVYCAVIEAMLSHDNVSHVALENFTHRFALNGTLGKLANIATECGELDKVGEGFLKSFTAGEPMEFDRKFKPALHTTPTARLMLAFNNRPRFTDPSSGLWRRMLLVPFTRQVPEDRRDRRLVDPSWWAESGELPGIQRWAIAGLHRLRQQGRFTRSQICEAALDDYRLEANPTHQFLLERCEANSFQEIPRDQLYAAYKDWCLQNGHKPKSNSQFGRDVRRIFPNVGRGSERTGSRGAQKTVYRGIHFIKVTED